MSVSSRTSCNSRVSSTSSSARPTKLLNGVSSSLLSPASTPPDRCRSR
ncbi:hypothetical protein IHE61_21770 [Streptomyces sp. GKU 257-1]|nr:hypothetical protein [Streptomyces sp. GKU 257-1]